MTSHTDIIENNYKLVGNKKRKIVYICHEYYKYICNKFN